jgi:hypothetical protein
MYFTDDRYTDDCHYRGGHLRNAEGRRRLSQSEVDQRVFDRPAPVIRDDPVPRSLDITSARR